ncbi:DUF2970 domain-containing protein [Aliidiomarina maris]|uniref:DUF2970 family protein n=1 Tax=Aliidiomarina maris TaxID=531312 RepID=A0A327WYQ0_9GAMM|nr:DUF2970 domain-containing protein [Aliidiomarina maris]MBA3987896.1 hypothetical protein [Idiomarina sp.]MCL5049584.1 DUF2970 domain-containing protein [Bacillota bacterium]RAJ98319.1 Protein of unknown function (DUF2970) [Aliidiomarina maris]RUO24856.1 hypothetical protein CWE07_07380 [Aliidiomarina maris]
MKHVHSSRPTFWQICFSVLAALFGVQSEKARARDFTQGNPIPYIVIGIIFIVLFVVLIALAVRLMLFIAA